MSPPRKPPEPGDRRPPGRDTTGKARHVADLAAARPQIPSRHHTDAGTVTIGDVVYVDATDTTPGCVEFRVHGAVEGDDPHFRVVNPPRFVPDVNGDVIINGRPFREDPLGALAEIAARHGGVAKDGRRPAR